MGRPIQGPMRSIKSLMECPGMKWGVLHQKWYVILGDARRVESYPDGSLCEFIGGAVVIERARRSVKVWETAGGSNGWIRKRRGKAGMVGV